MIVPLRYCITILFVAVAAAAWLYGELLHQPQLAKRKAVQLADGGASLPLDDQTKQAISRYIEGVKIPPSENNIAYAIRLDHRKGRLAISNGRMKEAYAIYQKILAISYDNSNLQGILIGLGALSTVSSHLYDNDEAMNLELLSYKAGRATNKRFEYGVAEMALGRLADKEDRALGMQWRLRAKESLKNTPHPQDYISLLGDLGADLRWSGSEAQAAAVFAQAWQKAKSLGNRTGERWAKQKAARLHIGALQKAGDCTAVLALADEALKLFKDQELANWSYYMMLHKIAKCHATEGNQEASRQAFWAAYSLYDLGRSKALGDEARAAVDRHGTDLINDFVETLLGEDKLHEALALLETNKARTLNDILGDDTQRSVYANWAKLESRHAQARADLLKDLTIDASSSRKARRQAYKALLRSQEDERRAARRTNEIRDVALGSTLSSDQLRRIQSQLPGHAAAISIFMSGQKVYTFIMTSRRIEFVEAKLSPNAADQTIRQLQLALTNPYTDFFIDPATSLYREMFQPLAARLGPEITHLVYSPDGLFNRIPLAVLYDGQQFVIERFTIQRIPSLRYLVPSVHLAQTRILRGIACVDPAVKDQRLPYQHETGEKLQSLYGSNMTVLAGNNCSQAQLENALPTDNRPTFLHIGAHGIFYPTDAMKSGIQLSAEDGNTQGAFWDARSMGKVDFSAITMVTLSSCETGLTDTKRSRDVFGILRTMFFGGARNVVAPLWSVGADATARLMQNFYLRFDETGSIPGALRDAQLQHLRSDQLRHPFFWSGYVHTSGPS